MSKQFVRQHLILDTLHTKGKLTLQECQELLNISISSVRRLLIQMEEDGIIIRTHTGIMPCKKSILTDFLNPSSIPHLAEKQSIASRAVELVEDNDSVFIDSGSTSVQFAVMLKNRLVNNDVNNVHVLTCSLTVMHLLDGICDLTLVGGTYRPATNDFAGYTTETFLNHFHFNKSFLGCDAINLKQGYMTTTVESARNVELVLHHSTSCYILSDSSKFDTLSFIRYAPTDSAHITAVITDSGISSAILDRYTAAGRNIMIAK